MSIQLDGMSPILEEETTSIISSKKESFSIKCRAFIQRVFPWIICATSFTVQFFVLGFYKSFGPVYVKLLKPKPEGLGGGPLATSWVASLSICTSYLSTPISFEVIRRLKFRAAMFLGAFLSGLGLFISAYADSVFILYVTFGFLFGIGSSLCYSSSLLILPNYFTTHWALAHGIALAGNGLGGLGLSPANGVLLESFGVKGGFKVMAIVSFGVLFTCGLIYQTPPEKTEEELKEEQERKKEADEIEAENKKDEEEIIYPDSIWKNKPLLLFLLSTYLLNFGYYVPYVHLVKLSLDVGVPEAKANMLPGILSLSQSVGKVFIGKVFSYGNVNRIRAYQISLIALCLATTFVPLLKTYPGLVAYAVTFGFSDGCGQATNMIIIGDLAGKLLLPKAYSTFLVCSASAFVVGPPIAGAVYSATGEYSIAFFMCGATTFSSAILLFAVTCIRDEEQHRLRAQKKLDDMKKQKEGDQADPKVRDSGIDISKSENSLLVDDNEKEKRVKTVRSSRHRLAVAAARMAASRSSLDFNKEMLTRSWHSIEFKSKRQKSRESLRSRNINKEDLTEVKIQQ